MTPTVHVLAYGRALCGSVHGVPSGWGRNMRWVSAFGSEWRTDATCCACLEMAVLLERSEFGFDTTILPPPGPDDGELE